MKNTLKQALFPVIFLLPFAASAATHIEVDNHSSRCMSYSISNNNGQERHDWLSVGEFGNILYSGFLDTSKDSSIVGKIIMYDGDIRNCFSYTVNDPQDTVFISATIQPNGNVSNYQKTCGNGDCDAVDLIIDSSGNLNVVGIK